MTKRLILSLLFLVALANAQWATSVTNIPLSSNLSGYIDGKLNFQLSGTTGCAAVNGTVGKDICTDSAGKVYTPSATGTPATWVQIPANALQINGAAVPASQACVGTNGSSQIVTASCGGAGAYAVSLGWTGTITEDTGDDVVYSVANVPALAAGACYRITWAEAPAVGDQQKLYIDSTAVAILQNLGGAQTWSETDFLFCNAVGSQTTQNITILSSAFGGASGGYSPYFTGTGAFPAVTSVNMATTHTFKMTTHSGSGGTVQGVGFRIGQ